MPCRVCKRPLFVWEKELCRLCVAWWPTWRTVVTALKKQAATSEAQGDA
jgi:hypothetical protein